MGSEAEEEEQGSAPPKLPLFTLSFPPMKSPEHYRWMVTPPHHSASIPFRWEEEPGKPRPCKSLSLPFSSSSSSSSSSSNTSATTATHFKKSLELPPRLLYEANYNNNYKTPSPTTVLKGPYVAKSIFHSFRLPRDSKISYFDGGGGGGGGSCGTSPERGPMGTIVLSKRGLLSRERSVGRRTGGLFGIWGKKVVFGSSSSKQGKRKDCCGESDGDSFAFSNGSSSFGEDIGGGGGGGGGGKAEMGGRINGEKSVLGLAKARSHFWATIYGAVKQVIPVRSKATAKRKKDC